MNKRELRQEIREAMDEAGDIEVEYEASEDCKKVTLTFTSENKMGALQFVLAMCEFANDFTELVCKSKNEKDPELS